MSKVHGSFKITDWQEKPFFEGDGKRKLTTAMVTSDFDGDLKGKSMTEYAMAYSADGTAEFVGIQRIEGELGSKKGSLVLRLIGVYDGKEARADWSVIPGAGTGDFGGLSGSGEFYAPHGKTGEYSLSLSHPWTFI